MDRSIQKLLPAKVLAGCARRIGVGRAGESGGRFRGFTLVELLVVIAIIVVMMTVMGPALNPLKSASDVNKSAYDLASFLDQARAYALMNNTYVIVGFNEYDSSKDANATPQSAGTGRVVVAAVASRDGTLGADLLHPASTWTANYTSANVKNLSAVGKPLVMENLHLASAPWALPATGGMARPSVGSAYLIGNAQFPKPLIQFSLPVGAALGSGKFLFDKWVLVYDSRGTPRSYSQDNPSITANFELDLQQTHGNLIPPAPTDPNSGNRVALQINGVTGRNTLYRP